jgi:NDP-sugar pyrophosphorylase family protein
MLPALVLAAGLGTRLDPLTRLVAKAAVPLGERTLVEHVLERLAARQVRDVVVNLHHRPETIAGAVGDGAHLGVRVRYSWEQPLLGSAGGPRHALPLLGADTFFVVNSEPICDVDLAALADAHRLGGAEATLAVVPNPAPDTFNGVEVDDEWRVRGFVPKGRAAGTWHFIGVQAVEASLFAGLPDGVAAESVHGIYRDLLDGPPGRLRAWHAATGDLLHLGTPREYLAAAAALGVTTSHGRVSQSVVWPGARIDPGADLTRAIVAVEAVPAGFAASDAALVPAAVAGGDERVDVRDGIAVFPFAT